MTDGGRSNVKTNSRLKRKMFNKLREPQQLLAPKALEILKKYKKVIIQMPPGVGKTMLATYLMAANRGKRKPRILWIAHETVLAEQAGIAVPGNLKHLGLPANFFDLTTSTRQGLSKKIEKGGIENYDFLVCDEIHSGTAGNNLYEGKKEEKIRHKEYKTILNAGFYKKLIMLSATPWDLDYNLISPEDIKNCKVSVSLLEASAKGWLHNILIRRIDTGIQSTLRHLRTFEKYQVAEDSIAAAKGVYADLNYKGITKVDALKFKKAQIASVLDIYLTNELRGKKVPPTIIYCNSVGTPGGKNNDPDSAWAVASLLNKSLLKRGVKNGVAVISGRMSDGEKNDIIYNFKHEMGSKRINVLVVCDMCRAGFDYPELEVAVDFGLNPDNGRDTIQKIGRLARLHPSKSAPGRFYYSRSLHNFLVIYGVRKELTEEFMQDALNEEEVTEEEKEIKASALLDAVGMIRDDVGEDDTINFGKSRIWEVEASADLDLGGYSPLLEQLGGGDKPARRSRVVETELFVERVEEKSSTSHEFTIRSAFSTVAGAADSEGSKQAIKDFYEANMKLPAPGHELNNRLGSYCSASSSVYDKDFDAWARSKGYGSRSSIAKQAVKDFYEATGKLPLDGHELYKKMSSYCSAKSGVYDKDFDAWARSCGYGSKSLVAKQAIKDFYKTNGKLPVRGHALYIRMGSYCNTSSKNYDNAFDTWARAKGYGWGK